MEEPIEIQCPWCGEPFTTFFDPSAGGQTYVEDCQVCCRPILMAFRVKRGQIECDVDRS